METSQNSVFANIIKYFIIIIHIFIGALLIFYCFVQPLIGLIQGFEYFTSTNRIFFIISAILFTSIGVLSITSALAFRKNKKWSAWALPLTPLVLISYLAYIIASSSKSDLAWTGGIYVMFGLLLLLFLITEIIYLVVKRDTLSD